MESNNGNSTNIATKDHRKLSKKIVTGAGASRWRGRHGGGRGMAAARPRRDRGRAAAAPRTPLKIAAACPSLEPRQTFLDCGAAATIRTFFGCFREFSGGPVAKFAQ